MVSAAESGARFRLDGGDAATDRPIGRGKKEGEAEEEGKAQFEPEVDDLSLIS